MEDVLPNDIGLTLRWRDLRYADADADIVNQGQDLGTPAVM